MSDELEQKAINAALSGDWRQAVKLNQQILKQVPNNVEALNRLARAYLELGETALAKKTYRTVLSLDRFNPIALKNLGKIPKGKVGKKQVGEKDSFVLDPDIFLEEPGKTKTVSLINLADKKTLSQLALGEALTLAPKARSISIADSKGVYLGRIPDDLSHRLLGFVKGGNRYQVFVKSVTSSELKVFIKEVFRSRKFANQPSFSLEESGYQAFTPPRMIHEGPPKIPSEEEEVG